MNFIFYDTETTGISTAFDQILQFGAIKTDADLKEIDRFEIRCRLLPYIVPAPGAMRVTGVTVAQLTDPALPSHYEMIRAIRAKLMEWSPAIFIGHNSLRFDETLLRQALYKTLHGPYLTHTHGNGRTDTLRMIQAVARFAPNALTIPIDDRGKQVFKLDRLAPANGFDHSAAHDAMGDVEATIHMARLMAERVPDYWLDFIRFAQKPAVMEFVQDEDVFSLTEFYYAKPYSWMVTAMDVNPDNGSEMLVFDLSNDPEELAAMDDAALTARFSERKRPVRGLRTNAAPIIVSYDKAPDDVREVLPDLVELRRRVALIKSDSALSQRLMDAYLQTREPRQPSGYIEEQIYDGFASHADNAIMERFHTLDWPQRTTLVNQLSDERLYSLGQRLIYVEAPDVMDEKARRDYDKAIARRLMADDETLPWLTYPKALTDVDELIAGAQGNEASLLAGHRDYLRERAAWAASLLS